MGYSKKASRRIKGFQPERELIRFVVELEDIGRDLDGLSLSEKDVLRSMDLRIKAVQAKSAIVKELLSKTVPSLQAVRAEVRSPKPLQLELSFENAGETSGE